MSRGSHTFIRDHDLSIRYAVNFPKSITIKMKRRKSGASLSMNDDRSKSTENGFDGDLNGVVLPENCLSRHNSHDSLNEVENEDGEIEFEELPMEMTDEKLIEEHTDDLWAAMPLVPAEILEKAVNADGKPIMDSINVVCSELDSAEKLLQDQYFICTYNYVKLQFMTHFGKLRVGRDIFVAKLHYIFDMHKEFGWKRLNLPNYYVTPKSIMPMDCMADMDEYNEKRTKLYQLLQILQPNPQIYQHKLYLYELLKLSGVIRVDDDPPIPMDQYDEYIMDLDELWATTRSSSDDNLEDDQHYLESMDQGSSTDDAPDPDEDIDSTGMELESILVEDEEKDLDHDDMMNILNKSARNSESPKSFHTPLLPLVKTKSKPGSTPTVTSAGFNFVKSDDFISADIADLMDDNSMDLVTPTNQYRDNGDFAMKVEEITKQFNVQTFNSYVRDENEKENEHFKPIEDSSDEDEEIMIIPQDADQYITRCAMNEEYAGNHHNANNDNTNDGSGDANNNDQNNTNDGSNGGDNNMNTSGGSGSGSGGDDGDEKKNDDNHTLEGPEDEVNENKEEEEDAQQEIEDQPLINDNPPQFNNMQQDIQIVDDPLDQPRPNRTGMIIKGLGMILVVILGVIFGPEFLSNENETENESLADFYKQTEDFLKVYDEQVIAREKDASYQPFKVEIPEDNPAQTWLDNLHVGSLVDALDIESKWYTGYVTNVDIKSGQVKIHYDDWSDRFDEWVDPQSGKLAPYRSRAIGGRFQGGLPGRPSLPIKPKNDSVVSEFSKMRITYMKQAKTIPDVSITILDDKDEDLNKYKEYVQGTFYGTGIIYNNRALYMSKDRIYLFYTKEESTEVGLWCIGTEAFGPMKCFESDALRPELIDSLKYPSVSIEKVVFAPAYLQTTRSVQRGFKDVGKKGLQNIPVVALNNNVMMPQVIVGTAGIPFDKREEIISSAAVLGYYMFDTGMQTIQKPLYYNHEYIKELNQIYGRSTIGISTKVPSWAHGYHSTIHNILSQLDTLDTDYLDLVVIEHPDCVKDVTVHSQERETTECEGHWLDTWRALEHLYGICIL